MLTRSGARKAAKRVTYAEVDTSDSESEWESLEDFRDFDKGDAKESKRDAKEGKRSDRDIGRGRGRERGTGAGGMGPRNPDLRKNRHIPSPSSSPSSSDGDSSESDGSDEDFIRSSAKKVAKRQLDMVRKNPENIKFIQKDCQYREVKDYVVRKDPSLINYIGDITCEYRFQMIERNYKYVEYLTCKTINADIAKKALAYSGNDYKWCWEAIKKVYGVRRDVPKGVETLYYVIKGKSKISA